MHLGLLVDNRYKQQSKDSYVPQRSSLKGKNRVKWVKSIDFSSPTKDNIYGLSAKYLSFFLL